LKDSRPEVFAKDAFGVGGAIALRGKTAGFGHLGEIKRYLIISTGALNFDGALLIVPNGLGDPSRIEISPASAERNPRKLSNAPIF
jgi:hypothetical protein